MAKKAKSFADKLRKMSEAKAKICTVCKGEIQRVMLVKSIKSEEKNSWKFNENMVNVCKCNEKEVYSA